MVLGALSVSSSAGRTALALAERSIASRPTMFATVPGASSRPAIEASSLVGGPAISTPEGQTSRAMIIGAGVLAVIGAGLVALKLRKRKTRRNPSKRRPSSVLDEYARLTAADNGVSLQEARRMMADEIGETVEDLRGQASRSQIEAYLRRHGAR